MPYAIEAIFDPDLELVVRGMWAALETAGVPTPARQGFRPHVSLALFDDVHEPLMEARLAAFAATTPLVPVQFDALGVFVSPGDTPGQDAIVWLAPIVTEGLIAVHRRVHEGVLPEAIRLPEPRYRTDRWMPHCTLTERVPYATAATAVNVLLPYFRPPLLGHLVEVELVRFFPAERRMGFLLGGTSAGA